MGAKKFERIVKTMFAQAMKRPSNYHQLSEREQWEIDGQLGILDWNGNCSHDPYELCEECKRKYLKKHKVKQGGKNSKRIKHEIYPDE
jgi:hypothetical protein